MTMPLTIPDAFGSEIPERSRKLLPDGGEKLMRLEAEKRADFAAANRAGDRRNELLRRRTAERDASAARRAAAEKAIPSGRRLTPEEEKALDADDAPLRLIERAVGEATAENDAANARCQRWNLITNVRYALHDAARRGTKLKSRCERPPKVTTNTVAALAEIRQAIAETEARAEAARRAPAPAADVLAQSLAELDSIALAP
jgi:hypothetical protein